MARSRLTRKAQKKMVKQTVVYGLLAVGLLLLFILVVMPRFVRIADRLFNSSVELEQTDNVPPQTPILAAPVDATNSASLPIKGVGEAGSKAVLVLNSEKLKEVEISSEGDFEFRVPLEEGENSLVVYSIDEAENESVKTREYQVILDTQAPEIAIEQPVDGSTIELRKNQITTILGSTEPKSKVFINDRLVYPKEDGSFMMTYQLSEGKNELKIKVIDRAGNVSEKTLSVEFRF